MLCAENAIPQRALVVIGARRIAGPREHVARELEHILGHAAFLRVSAQLGRQHARICVPRLAVAGSAGGVGAPLGHLAPEVLGDPVVARLGRQLVAAGRAYELARRLRDSERGQAMRLVTVTGYGQRAGQLAARAAGFDEHFIKPIDLKALTSALRR
jgi:hypothetical protein